MMRKETMTDALDVLALLLVAAGMSIFIYKWIGWLCLVVGGLIILAGSTFAARLNRTERDD